MQDGRHFILQLMKFVTETAGKTLPFFLQELLDECPAYNNSYLTKNIKNAIRIYIHHYLDNGKILEDVGSLEYANKMNEVNTPEAFLKFLGFYAKKSVSEQLEDSIDSSFAFYSSFSYLLENFRKMDQYVEFWAKLDLAATRFVIKSRNKFYGQYLTLADFHASDEIV